MWRQLHVLRRGTEPGTTVSMARLRMEEWLALWYNIGRYFPIKRNGKELNGWIYGTEVNVCTRRKSNGGKGEGGKGEDSEEEDDVKEMTVQQLSVQHRW